MNYNKIYFLVFLFSLPNALLSQSFEKKINLDLLNNINLNSNESNAYITNSANIIFFNSTFNNNNKNGIDDQNDIWYSMNIDGEWKKTK